MDEGRSMRAVGDQSGHPLTVSGKLRRLCWWTPPALLNWPIPRSGRS